MRFKRRCDVVFTENVKKCSSVSVITQKMAYYWAYHLKELNERFKPEEPLKDAHIDAILKGKKCCAPCFYQIKDKYAKLLAALEKLDKQKGV